jgi:hypothetical protein
MVFLANSPGNAIKSAVRPILAAYRGPWVTQTWSLFAPVVDESNYRIIVRGQTADHHLTPWYDATEYFLISMRNNPLTTARPLAEALYHAAAEIGAERTFRAKSLDGILLVRTSAMILRSYAGPRVKEMQVEIDDTTIAVDTHQSKRERIMRLGWMTIPIVTDLKS